MTIGKISPLPNLLGITPDGQVIALDTINKVLKLPAGKLGVAPDAMPLIKQTAQQPSMGGMGILNPFPTKWAHLYVGWPWGIPTALWIKRRRANQWKRS